MMRPPRSPPPDDVIQITGHRRTPMLGNALMRPIERAGASVGGFLRRNGPTLGNALGAVARGFSDGAYGVDASPFRQGEQRAELARLQRDAEMRQREMQARQDADYEYGVQRRGVADRREDEQYERGRVIQGREDEEYERAQTQWRFTTALASVRHLKSSTPQDRVAFIQQQSEGLRELGFDVDVMLADGLIDDVELEKAEKAFASALGEMPAEPPQSEPMSEYQRAQLGLSYAELAQRERLADMERTGQPALQLPAGVQSQLLRQYDTALAEATDEVARINEFVSLSQDFINKSQGYWGLGEGWLSDLGQIFSMDTSSLKSITDTLAPKMRQPGSGAMSDRDVEMFKNAVVNINNTREGNQRIVQMLQAAQRRALDYQRFLSSAYDPSDPAGFVRARQAWAQYSAQVSPFEKGAPSFDQWASGGGQPATRGTPVIDAPGVPDLLRPPQQAMAAPSSNRPYIDPQSGEQIGVYTGALSENGYPLVRTPDGLMEDIPD